ncbi:L-2-hydroxyglutarate oxidase [Nocardia brasiliensis]|uniref:Hydroxyglutarate oxidase n=1 Tax=Nocardia brasiliensis (strain ATCC 700358 / HUJEG-1) TaxID=1133849 RepID=K0FA77_NOCB7|nr:L-2-hydroxyglutarate oxidase [Nocardia brasiliensis]AFU06320.1 hydroxyglutarate oxidase [Nocardia brasiliensis ATCC 700358]OCF88516.1 hydroxyglutarate oxidase [Nocardia brasiliensis]
MPHSMYDFCVIGGGIVGVATAHRILRRHPGATLVLLEKAAALATHQTGHNSGVIHSGIYYPPDSLKSRLCRQGARWTKEFAAAQGIPFEVCGKLLVATDAAEQQRMLALHERSVTNGVAVELIDAAELHRREPKVRGVGALFVPDTGIVDYTRITAALAAEVAAAGGEVVFGAEVAALTETDSAVTATGPAGSWSARTLVVCAGLQADRLARMAGLRNDFRIVPFRGEYYQLPPERAGLVRTLIYPIPDPELPFLGVHLSPTIDGTLTVGPNAVLGLAREGYRKGSFDARDAGAVLGFPGVHRVARANIRTGLRELRNSVFKRGYLAECRKYCPELTLADLRPREAGIRAQAVLRDGTLVHDFMIERTPRSVHVLNAPSPAATSAMPIAEHIVAQL